MAVADDIKWMGKALELAKEAAQFGEVPVGAILVRGGEALAQARNEREASHNPLWSR